MSGTESDDDVTVDVEETLLDEIRAEAARRAAAQSEGDQDPVVQHGGSEVLGGGSATAGETVLAVGAGGFDQDVPGIEGYGALREIGRGGFSQVYEALQFEFERWVAIKVLNDAIERDEIAEFNRECRLMGVLSRHPNIVTVFESAFTADHRPCIVMELFPHGSYLNILQSAGPLALEDLLPLTVRISGALATAHRQGMVHGDVKPHNIFCSDFGTPALGDFGLATLMHSGLGASKTRLSLYYAAPELIERGVSALSPFADQYSLAATLYTLATGRRPFDTERGETTRQLLSRMLSEPAPHLGAEFPPALGDALVQAMSREPKGRHRDLIAFAAEMVKIEQQLGFQPTEIPVSREAGRYVGQTSELGTPRSRSSTSSRDIPVPPSLTGNRPLGVASPVAARESGPHPDSPPAVRTARRVDTSPAPSTLSGGTRAHRIPLWAKIGVTALLLGAAVAGTIALIGGDGESIGSDSDVVESPTSESPTSESPTSEPPTSEPPTSEPPTSEPPTSEPPTSEPPTSEPDVVDSETAPVSAAPENVEVEPVAGGFLVSWEEPPTDDLSIARYRVQWKGPDESFSEARESRVESAYLDENNILSVPGLEEGVSYNVRVVTETEDGKSYPSESVPVLIPPREEINSVAFTRGSTGDIYIVGSEVADVTQVTSSATSEVARSWSPDGAWIAMDARDSDGDWEIWMVSRISGVKHQLTCNTVNDWSAAWSNDGIRIAYVSGRSGDHDVSMMNVATGEVYKLTTGSSDDHSPSWSPDGTQVAFSRGPAGTREIWVVDVGSGAVIQLTLSERDNAAPSWSPDGSRIAYASGYGPDRDIMVMDAAGENTRAVTTDSHHDDNPSWSPDSSEIAFARGHNGGRDILVADAASGTVRPLVLGVTDDYAPVWSPGVVSQMTAEPRGCSS